MAFFQEPPRLGNQYETDELLREYVARTLPPEVLRAVESELRELGELGGGELFRLELEDRLNEPTLTQWDAWGNRVDRIEVSPLWQRAEKLSAERGLVATAYEQKWGEHSRVVQFVMNYLVQASLDVYSCPLAMTDGAARTLLETGNRELIDRAVPRLTSRDPARFWTSGQWMTERTGGSDVGRSETEARRAPDGSWSLWGTKWFTSATTSQMTLTLARPEGGGAGGRGLALFYLELRDEEGRYNGVRVNRLKDKLGTRKVPTAELTLEGARAVPVAGLDSGTRNITPMLNITRTWNAMGASWGTRRAMALVKDYAGRRVAFGDALARKPLHVETVAGMQAETEAVFHLTFRAAELLGRMETRTATESEVALARLVVPLAKLTTGKQAVAVASEALECFGGAGYVEDTGLPLLLRDAQVLPIWEGTTNVLSLDVLRALGTEGTLAALVAEGKRALGSVTHAELFAPRTVAEGALARAVRWVTQNGGAREVLEAGARRFALTLGRTLELALCCHHAQWCLDQGHGERAAAAARRFARHGVDLVEDAAPEADAALLAR